MSDTVEKSDRLLRRSCRNQLSSRPELRGVQHAKHGHCRFRLGVDHDVVGSNDQLAGSRYPAWAPAFRVGLKECDLVLNFFDQGKGGGRIVVRDIVNNGHQVGYR